MKKLLIALLLLLPASATAQRVLYIASDLPLMPSLRIAEDQLKLAEAGELNEMPRTICSLKQYDRVVLLNELHTDLHFDGEYVSYLIIYRVQVVSGAAKGCIGFAPKAFFQRHPPPNSNESLKDRSARGHRHGERYPTRQGNRS